MSLLCWNVRGLGNLATFNALRKLLRVQDPDFVFLIEMKKKEEAMVKLCGSLGYSNCEVVERIGKQGGGLAFCWKDNQQVNILDATSGFVDALIVISGKRVRLIGFYGNPETGERHHS